MSNEEISVTLPPEPAPGAVVLTVSGVVYQRQMPNLGSAVSSMFGNRQDWVPAVAGGVAVSWLMLLTYGPLLLMTNDDTDHWLAEQERQGKS